MKIPFMKVTPEWAVGTFLTEYFPPSGTWSLPERPALTRRHVRNMSAEYLADPFIFMSGKRYYLFAEALNQKTGIGEIGYAESGDGLKWDWKGTALCEAFHLSYPYLFREGTDIYMVPETGSQNAVFLYRAESFPARWQRVATLLEGLPFNDTSIFRRGGLWWMFTGIHPFVDDTLCLFYSKDLRGPWQAHPMNPIIGGNPVGSRPGGRIVESGGVLYRFGQNCSPYYGYDLNLYEITELSAERYAERPVNNPFLSRKMRIPFWMAHGRHHLDALETEDGRWLVAVDGFRWRWHFGPKMSVSLSELRAIASGWARNRNQKKVL